METAALLKWLGTMIAQPLQKDHKLPPLSPFGTPTEQEAAAYITPSATLKPYQRVEIYHRQYWWRLADSLRTNFPMLVRLFGYTDFEQKLAVPYLKAHPPQHWALCELGRTLPQWLKANYHEEDRYLVVTSAEIDWAAESTFVSGSLPPLACDPRDTAHLLNQKIKLQPFVHLFALKGDLLAFREALLEHDPGYYDANPFPSITCGDYYFVLYRTPANVVTWEEVSPTQHWLLSQFAQGETIESACARLEEKGGAAVEEALSELPFWFKKWTVLRWVGQS